MYTASAKKEFWQEDGPPCLSTMVNPALVIGSELVGKQTLS